jgi:hypothetical protein
VKCVISLHNKCEEWLHSTSLLCEEWHLFTYNVKRDSSPDSSTENLKSDSSTRQMWWVTPLYRAWLLITTECLLSTWNVMSDSTWLLCIPNVKSDSSVQQIWWVAQIHNKCKEWLHSTPKVKSDFSLQQIWRVIINMMSDYSQHQIRRVTTLHIK